MRYIPEPIRSFRHKGLAELFERRRSRRVGSEMRARCLQRLEVLQVCCRQGIRGGTFTTATIIINRSKSSLLFLRVPLYFYTFLLTKEPITFERMEQIDILIDWLRFYPLVQATARTVTVLLIAWLSFYAARTV
ncbi:uncharacterized protein METZ01_LOCUS392587, partial [marine metagenome]